MYAMFKCTPMWHILFQYIIAICKWTNGNFVNGNLRHWRTAWFTRATATAALSPPPPCVRQYACEMCESIVRATCVSVCLCVVIDSRRRTHDLRSHSATERQQQHKVRGIGRDPLSSSSYWSLKSAYTNTCDASVGTHIPQHRAVSIKY